MPSRKNLAKAIFFAAVLSLAIMVVALGSAAKHSQFKQHAHHSFYLGQAVKMVTGDSPAHADPLEVPAFIQSDVSPAFPAPALIASTRNGDQPAFVFTPLLL